MADVKKVTIEKKNLPPVNANNQYAVRYRVVGEDKNRISAWSPIYIVTGPDIGTVNGDLIILGNVCQLVWGDELDRPNYDVFAKFDDGEWFYHGTPSIHTYSFLNIGVNTVQARVQVEGIVKEVNDNLLIYQSPVVPVPFP